MRQNMKPKKVKTHSYTTWKQTNKQTQPHTSKIQGKNKRVKQQTSLSH